MENSIKDLILSSFQKKQETTPPKTFAALIHNIDPYIIFETIFHNIWYQSFWKKTSFENSLFVAVGLRLNVFQVTAKRCFRKLHNLLFYFINYSKVVWQNKPLNKYSVMRVSVIYIVIKILTCKDSFILKRITENCTSIQNHVK